MLGQRLLQAALHDHERAVSHSPQPIAVAEQAEIDATAADQRARKARALAQFLCPHEHVISSAPGIAVLGSRTPFRVCLACGFAEHSWSCGNQILTAKPERDFVPYEEALTHVRGSYPRIHANAQFVGYYLDVEKAGGRPAYRRAVLLQVLGLTEDDVREVTA